VLLLPDYPRLLHALRRLMMATDLTVILENRPGTLADVGEILGKAGINIDGVCGFPCDGRGILHILVEDAEAARLALEKEGVQVTGECEVVVLKLEDRPGALGKIARKIARHDINVNLTYLATRTRLVIGSDNIEKVKTIL
jgi:hypothetical protein